MSTAQLIGGHDGLPTEPAKLIARRSAAAVVLPLAIATALLIVILYAAFDHGAVALPVDTRLQVAIVRSPRQLRRRGLASVRSAFPPSVVRWLVSCFWPPLPAGQRSR